MGKKILAIAGSICIILIWVAIQLMATPTSAQAKELSFSIHFGPKVSLSRYVFVPFAEEIKKRTNGQYTVKIYYGGTLAKVKDAYNAVEKGIVDMTYTQHAHTPGQFPLVGVMGLPFLTPSTQVSTMVLHGLYKEFPEIRKEHKDVHLLYLWSTLPIEIHTVKKPVRKLEDIKGLKIATHASARAAVEGLGAVPVVMGTPAFYPSLEKGVVDGVAIAWGAWKGWRLYDVTKYHTNAHISTWPCVIAMNMNTWNSLPPDIQKIVTEVAANGPAWHCTTVTNILKEAVAIAKERGQEIFDLSPAEFARWKATGKPAYGKWVSKMNAKGLPGQAVLDEALRLTEKWKGKKITDEDLMWRP